MYESQLKAAKDLEAQLRQQLAAASVDAVQAQNQLAQLRRELQDAR